jgi:hypothetical protein
MRVHRTKFDVNEQVQGVSPSVKEQNTKPFLALKQHWIHYVCLSPKARKTHTSVCPESAHGHLGDEKKAN